MRPTTDDYATGVVDSISDYEERRERGEDPDLRVYKERLGSDFSQFVDLVQARQALIDIVEPDMALEDLPREFGPYTLQRVLGRGGAGVVYEARNNNVGRLEAVKVLRAGFEPGGHTYKLFEQEAAACAKIEHPQVARIHNAGKIYDERQSSDVPYYAMELIEGPTLKAWARDGHMESVSELFAGVAGIADALDEFHKVGIIHRDVKPSNIMVRPDGTFVLTDFGLAHTDLGESWTRTGEIMGTLYYMPVEQMMGDKRRLGPRADVYALGATLYDILGRRPPFGARNVFELMQRAQTERPTPLHQLDPKVPKTASNIVMKCLEREPEDRFADAAELRDALQAFADGAKPPVPIDPVTPTQRAWRWVKRQSPKLAVAAVVVALLVYGYMNRDVTLTVTTEAGFEAQLAVDGTSYGPMPTSVDVKVGEHTFTVMADGFKPKVETMELYGDVELPPYGPEDLEVENDALVGLFQVGRVMGVASPVAVLLQQSRSVRGPDDEAASMVFPRGSIRAEDLDLARFEIYDIDAIEEAGEMLILRRGNEELYRVSPDLDQVEIEIPIPQSVRDALRDGDEIDVVYQIGSQRWSSRVAVTDGDPALAEALERIDTELVDQPAWVRAYFRSRLLYESGLYTGSLREARKAIDLDAGPEDGQTLAPIVYARAALAAMDQDTSDLASRLVVATNAFPEETQRDWIRTKPGK